MASGSTNNLESRIINFFFRNDAGTDSGTTPYLALYSVAPGETGGGTELTGNGYARIAITFGADTAGVSTNTNTLTFTAAGGAWSAIVGHGICDASTAGNVMMYEDSVAGPTLSDGDSYEFGAADITLTFT